MSLGDAGFLQLLRVVSSDYGKPWRSSGSFSSGARSLVSPKAMASSTLAGAQISPFYPKCSSDENSDDRTRFMQVLYNPVIKR